MVIYNFSKEFGENGGQCVKYFVKKKRKIIKPWKRKCNEIKSTNQCFDF